MSDRWSFRPATNVADSCSGPPVQDSTHVDSSHSLGCGTSWCDLGSGFRSIATTVEARGTCRHHSGKTRESATPAPFVNKINLNTATATELDMPRKLAPRAPRPLSRPEPKASSKTGTILLPAMSFLTGMPTFELDDGLGIPAGIRRGDLFVRGKGRADCALIRRRFSSEGCGIGGSLPGSCCAVTRSPSH